MKLYQYGLDFYCMKCAPKGSMMIHPCDMRTDYPMNCVTCHVPLENALTPLGVAYAIEQLEAEVQCSNKNMVLRCYEGTYYQGKAHKEIVLDWAAFLIEYADLSLQQIKRVEQAMQELEAD